jgi:hypothetical protein
MQAFFAAANGQRPSINLASLPAEYHCLSSLIEQCWQGRTDERPPAQEVVTKLLALLQHLEHDFSYPLTASASSLHCAARPTIARWTLGSA